MKNRIVSVALVTLLSLTASLHAQETQPDSAKVMLQQAAEAALKVKNVTYAFSFDFVLPQFESPVNYTGETKIIRGEDMDSTYLFLKGRFTGPTEVIPEPYDIGVGTDTKTAYMLDGSAMKFIHGPYDETKDYLISRGSFGLVDAFVAPDPFAEEMDATFLGMQDSEEINGVMCDVLAFELGGGMARAKLYLGKEDHLPRRIERRIGNTDEANVMILTISNLNTNADLKKSEFTITAPEGYTAEVFEAPKQRERKPLLSVGDVAPEFSLKNGAGDMVNLKDLRGNIVVLDFWATWCGPCKLAMPGVQKVHEYFAGKPVRIFGLNTWEDNPEDAVAFMKDKGYTYGLLLEGNEVSQAYHVSGIPTFYVIDAEGNILKSTVGYDEDGDAKLIELIEAELKKMDQ